MRQNISPNSSDIQTRFSEYLHSLNLRNTPERFMILEAVITMDGYFTAEDLYDKLENGGFHVSLATVYNSLQLLDNAGLVRKHLFDNQGARYEKAVTATSQQQVNHNLICTRCGKVKQLRDTELSRIISAKSYRGFTPSYSTLYVYGLCSRCRRMQKQKAKN